jgi:hypothetical protein
MTAQNELTAEQGMALLDEEIKNFEHLSQVFQCEEPSPWLAKAIQLRALLEKLAAENAALRTAGNKLRQSAEMIGYVQDAQTYRDSVSNIAAWDNAAMSKDPTK